jgi:solute:Na+ symporter, SSS family
MATMSALDYGVIILYFVIVFVIAFVVTMKERKTRGAEGYFLGGRSLGWFVIGASLFASNIGSEHLVGLAGSGAKGDFVGAQFELLAALILLVLGWIFVPFYLRSNVFTMPEFLERRYASNSRNYLSVISIVAYILTKISVTIFAGALVFDKLLGIPFWTGAILVIFSTGIYTIFGGLKAVVYTDMIQMFILLGGAIAVTYYGLDALGGWDEARAIITNSAGEKSTEYLSLWRSADHTNFPWTGILFGAPILGIWYWCTDQFIVQRVLSAKNLSQARKGTIFAGFLKLLPLFLFVIPGVIAYALSVEDPRLLIIDGTQNYDAALPAVVMAYLPSGIRGLVAAGLLAALMSSLSSVFNSCSTLFTIDFWQRWRPESTDRELVRVGQIAVVILVFVGVAWIPFMESLMNGEGLFKYLQSIQAYISPPIAAVFLLGLFFRRLNAKGAIYSLWTGFFLGMGRLALEYLTAGYKKGEAILQANPDGMIIGIVEINFLHFAILLFAICSVVLVVVSLTAPAPELSKIESITYSKAGSLKLPELVKSYEFWLSVLLVLAVVAIWIIFSPYGIA